MKLLLDTHVFLWWIADAEPLSETARELIADGRNTLHWSAASSWEIAIKYALGRLPLPEPPEEFLPQELAKNRFQSLPIKDVHAFRVGHLPPHHGDPFDRMLIAQSQVESMVLLSSDRKFSLYDVEVRW